MPDFELQMMQEPGFTTQAHTDTPLSGPLEIDYGTSRLLKYPDGSVYHDEHQEEEKPHIDPNDHDQNLAEVLPPHVVSRLGAELKAAIEEDKESQSAYFEALADIIRLLGLSLERDNKEDLPFKGASQIYSTALFESALDLVASIISSLFPSQGIVDCVITGEANDQIRDTAYRKSQYFNYYLTNIAKEFKKESERTFLWAILSGSCYKKVFIDPTLGRPTSMFIRPEDFIVNREHTSHLSAPRKTHILHMSARDLEVRKITGLYRNVNFGPDNNYQTDDGVIQSTLDEISGVNTEGSNNYLDDEYVIYECHLDYYIKEDPLAPDFELGMPYIVTLDAVNGEVLSIRRNWEKGDFKKKKREYFVNYSLLPSLDGEGYGMVHYAGQLADAATAITRQLINTGTYSNFPGGIYAAGIRIENNNIRPAPGEFLPVQTGGLPIDQVLSPLPYREPSQSLKELKAEIEDSIKKPSAIINQTVAEMTPRAPMGSVLAMLESLQKVPNAIIQRFHESFKHELMLFNDRFAEWFPDNQPYPFLVPGGEHVIMKQDFQDHVIVIPASDPSLQNSTYRFMQSEIILNQAKSAPEIHNLRYAFEYFYKNMNLSPEEIKQILPEQQETQPFSGDPITEDQYILTGKPVKATVWQDHKAHIVTHQLILANPNATDQAKAAATAHIQEHEALDLLVDMQAKIGFQMPEDPSQIPPEMQNQIAVAAAQVAQQKLAEMQAQQNPQQGALDPTVVMDEDSKRKAEIAHERIEVDKLKLILDEQKMSNEFALEQLKIEQKQQTDLIKIQLEEKKMELDHVYKEKDQLLKEIQMLRNSLSHQQEGFHS